MAHDRSDGMGASGFPVPGRRNPGRIVTAEGWGTGLARRRRRPDHASLSSPPHEGQANRGLVLMGPDPDKAGRLETYIDEGTTSPAGCVSTTMTTARTSSTASPGDQQGRSTHQDLRPLRRTPAHPMLKEVEDCHNPSCPHAPTDLHQRLMPY